MIRSNTRTSLRAVVAFSLIGILLSAVMRPTWAANAEVTVDVKAVPTSVSVSRPGLMNFAALQVTITPTQNNVINRLVFTSKATVLTSNAALKWKESIVSIEDGACSYDDVSKVATCTQEQARNGDELSYILIYEAPTAGASLKFEWRFTYSKAGSPGSASSDIVEGDTVLAGLTETGTDEQKLKLQTFVPSPGGTFFTGFLGNRSADSSDKSTTTLVIPSGLGLKNPATIEEDDGVAPGNTNDTLTTNTTTITLPSSVLFSTPISIYLQRDGSTIRSATQNSANRVPIYYTADATEPWKPGIKYPLKDCADPLVGGAPTASEAVCVSQRIYVKSNMVGTDKPGGGKYTTLDVGDFLFVLLALQNGKAFW